MKTFIVSVDYKFSHKKKGFMANVRRKSLNRKIENIIKEFSNNPPYEQHEMYFTTEGAVQRNPPDRKVYLYRDDLDVSKDIEFEISELNGVQAVAVYEPISAEDLT